MKDSSIFKSYRNIAYTLLQPAISQWSVLLTYIVWIGWSSLLQNPFYRWFIIMLHAYFVAALVDWSKSKVVKVLAYSIMFILFIIEATLETVYDLAISPGMLQLLVETNVQESQEFLSSLIETPTFWLTMGGGNNHDGTCVVSGALSPTCSMLVTKPPSIQNTKQNISIVASNRCRLQLVLC